jgi:CxxC-x17-CxxC domain-containing protein
LSFADKTLACRECGGDFTFSVGEQEFYAEKGLLNEPQRCPDCRAQRRRERSGSDRREMHEVVCAGCGGTASVPFLPRNDKPVYCSTCFAERNTVGAR